MCKEIFTICCNYINCQLRWFFQKLSFLKITSTYWMHMGSINCMCAQCIVHRTMYFCLAHAHINAFWIVNWTIWIVQLWNVHWAFWIVLCACMLDCWSPLAAPRAVLQLPGFTATAISLTSYNFYFSSPSSTRIVQRNLPILKQEFQKIIKIKFLER